MDSYPDPTPDADSDSDFPLTGRVASVDYGTVRMLGKKGQGVPGWKTGFG
ncbi:MAG: hypothetical protein WBD31_02755 [Rubripirellula sp.]